jgi:DNA (cytosine-5)-methyltransferase 1
MSGLGGGARLGEVGEGRLPEAVRRSKDMRAAEADFVVRETLAPPWETCENQSGEGSFTIVDLFAGIGGMRAGFERVGGRCVFTSEWDRFCQQAYRHAFPDDVHAIAGDITQVDERDIPDHDVLLAGFPCQPFSIAGVSKKNALGRPHGFSCLTQGTLFFDVARVLKEKRPKAFLLENVKNLMSHDRGRTFRIIRRTLMQELGYHLVWKVLDGGHFVPQHRERILLVGFREKSTGYDEIDLELPVVAGARPVLSRILHSEDGTEEDLDQGRYLEANGRVREKYTLSDKLWDYLQRYAEKHRSRGNGFGFGLFGPGDRARTLSARYYKDGSEILIDQDGSRNPRRLTPRECARLMGFPDTFPIIVSDTRAYKQFGNSVVVPLIEHAARSMKPYILNPEFRRPGFQRRLF